MYICIYIKIDINLYIILSLKNSRLHSHKTVLEALKGHGMGKSYIETLANIHKQAKANVKRIKDTPEFHAGRGVRHG